MSSGDLVAALEIFIRAVVNEMSTGSDCSDSVHLYECRDMLVKVLDKELKDE